MRLISHFAFWLCLSPALFAAGKQLEIYFIDSEGGGSTLIVTPSGESLLADSGNPGNGDRDPKRIAEVARMAGLTKIDYLLTTHFDSDHSGGAPALAKLIPIGHFLDHGDSIETEKPRDAERWKAYVAAAGDKRMVMKPGDRIALKGMHVVVVTSNGEVLSKAINGGKANTALCEKAEQKPPDLTENARCLGFLLSYGKFSFLDLGDLTWDKELLLACPVNKVGKVSLYQATMHGFYNDWAGAPAHLFAIQPQVIIANNGARKALKDAAYERIGKVDGLEDLWQLHLALDNSKGHNTSEDKIANLEPTADCKGNWLKVLVQPDGHYTVTNGRNHFSKSYTAR